MNGFSLNTKSNVNYNLFNNDVKKAKNLNPFKNEPEDNKKTGSSLLNQLQSANIYTIMSNSLFAAAVKGDPYAVWGITSQIRIG